MTSRNDEARGELNVWTMGLESKGGGVPREGEELAETVRRRLRAAVGDSGGIGEKRQRVKGRMPAVAGVEGGRALYHGTGGMAEGGHPWRREQWRRSVCGWNSGTCGGGDRFRERR